MSRSATVQRKTGETDIRCSLILDSMEPSSISTGVPFFDHMLDALSRHARWTLEIECNGDTHIDDHHSVEDVGLVLGEAFNRALGEREGIQRYGDALVPMDESLVHSALDISGRPFFLYTGDALQGTIGTYSEELTLEFLRAFTVRAAVTLHVRLLHGENRHHIHEAVFKSLATALYRASSLDPLRTGEIPSTKGSL